MEFKLPEIGEGVQEGEILKWHAQEGESLKKEQPLVDVMTDKASVEIVVPVDCVVKKHMVAEGKMCKVGGVLAVLETAGGAAALSPAPASAAAPKSPAAPTPAPVAAAPSVAKAPSGASVRAFPATRKLAREMGVDLSGLEGTGPEGRVTKDDIKTAAVAGPSMVATKLPSGPREERVAVRGIRRSIVKTW